MKDIEFAETTGSVAREAGCLPETVRRFADGGLLDFRRLRDGTRVFRADAAERVRQIMADRRNRAASKVVAS
jgi:DNA-binding transcriptional MerR regulator